MEHAENDPEAIISMVVVYKVSCPSVGDSTGATKPDVISIVSGDGAKMVLFVAEATGMPGAFR